MSDWKTLSSNIIHETHWIRLVEDKVKIHTGKKLTYTYIQTVHPGVAIVAVDAGGNILLQKNYRHTLKKTNWEIPAGHMEDDETPLTTAKRELLEETGLTSEEWVDLGEIELVAGIGDVGIHLFAAESVQPSNNNEQDEDEPISEQQFMSQSEIRRMLRANEIFSATSIVGLYRYLATIEAKENI